MTEHIQEIFVIISSSRAMPDQIKSGFFVNLKDAQMEIEVLRQGLAGRDAEYLQCDADWSNYGGFQVITKTGVYGSYWIARIKSNQD